MFLLSTSEDKQMTKQEFIGKYLDRKMKNHNLPMGMAYYNLLGNMTEKAEKAWKVKRKRLKKIKTNDKEGV